MKIWLYTVTHNEARILPWFLRHYAAFCERIVVFDDQSTDGTQEIVKACPSAELRAYPYDGKLDDRKFIELARNTYPEARGRADWVIWCDPDEFLYHPKLMETLAELLRTGVEVPLTRGFQMIADKFPKFHEQLPGNQMVKVVKDGIEDPVYAKPVIFRPHVDMGWEPGKHYAHGAFNRGRYAGLKVLHYRCLGLEYLRERHARNYQNCSPANLAGGLGSGVYPGHAGHMSEPWFKAVMPTARDVIEHSTFHELNRVIHHGEDIYAGTNKTEIEFQPDWGSEHPWFADTIARVQPQVLIEVGTFLGRSAIHTAGLVRAAGLDSALIAVDTWLGDHEHWTSPEVRPLLKHRMGRPQLYHTFRANVLAAGLNQHIIPLPIDSVSGAKLLSILGIKADLIYIDGGHEGGEVYRDVANYWTLLRAGGAMLFDDFADGRFPGLQADVERFAREQGKTLEVSGHKARLWR